MLLTEDPAITNGSELGITVGMVHGADNYWVGTTTITATTEEPIYDKVCMSGIWLFDYSFIFCYDCTFALG